LASILRTKALSSSVEHTPVASGRLGLSLRSATVALLLPPLALVIVFFVIPLAYLFYASFLEPSQSELFGSRLTLANYTQILSDDFYQLVILRTLTVSAVVVGLSILIGYPAALFVARLSPRGRLMMLMVLMLPLMISNVVRAYGWVAILGRRGIINGSLQGMGLIDRPLSMMFGIEAIALGLLTVLLPYVIISIANTVTQIDKVYGEAAHSLGASPLRTFIHVTWPLSSPGVAAGLMLSFFLMLSAYVTIALLGGPRYKLLVSMIFDAVVAFQWSKAAALAFILLVIALMGALLIQLVLRPQRVRGKGA
jgi:putative spermidine/putrescine transport system permease protein